MPSSSPALEIRVLGPLEVHVDGEPLRVDTRKATAILALLAVERRPYARDELAAMLWPESDDESARSALRRTLSVLRSALGDRWLRVDRATVALAGHGAGVWVDLAALEAGASGNLTTLAQAATLARGPFLAGFSLRDSPDFDDWRATRAVTVERSVVGLLERLVAAAEAAGDPAAAIAAADRLVELDPLDEPARRRLMVVLARAGDRASAIRQYRATVAVLERELGVAPLAETTDLYEAIRDDRVAPPGLSAAAATSRVEAAATPAPVPIEPPARLPMLGRRRELQALRDALRSSSSDGRVATVTGEAGIGKSRLVETLAATAGAEGAIVLTARAFPAEGSIAYAPIVELLRTGFARPGAAGRLAALAPATLAEVERLVALPDGLGAGATGTAFAASPAARSRLLEAISTVLATVVHGPAPGIVAVEDLQWADDASREVLLYLARRLTARPLLLVLTWRPEDLEPGTRAFAGAAQGLPGATTVRLERLDDVVVGALAEAAAAAGHAGLGRSRARGGVRGACRSTSSRRCGPAREPMTRRRREVSASSSASASRAWARPRARSWRPARSSAARSTSRRCVVRVAARRTRPSRRSRSSCGAASSARSPLAANPSSTSGTRGSGTPPTPRSGWRDGGCSTGGSRRSSARTRSAATSRAASPRWRDTSSPRAGTRRPPRRTARPVSGRAACMPTGRPWSTSAPRWRWVIRMARGCRSRSARCARRSATTRGRSPRSRPRRPSSRTRDCPRSSCSSAGCTHGAVTS